MNGNFYLLVDDKRNYMNMEVTARTYRRGLASLRDDPVTHLILDNDLGGKKEGHELLAWARDHNCVPASVCIVSANPVAVKRMEDILTHDLGYVKTRDWWSKPIVAG
jgi:hypothetical protein